MTGLSRLFQPMILIVDDDPDVLATTAHMLRVRGFRVVTATDKAAALAACQQAAGQIDALVADLSLPGDLAGDMARSVGAACPQVKTVYVTGIPRHVAVGSGLVRPDAPYLEKPVDPEVLSGVLRSLLSQGAAP